MVDVPFISVEWTSLKHCTQKLRAGTAETNGVPENENNLGLEREVHVSERRHLWLHSCALANCSLCQMPGHTGACETQEDAGAGAGTAGGVR